MLESTIGIIERVTTLSPESSCPLGEFVIAQLYRITLCIVLLLSGLTSLSYGASATWSATPTNNNWVTDSSTNNWSSGIGTFPGGIAGTTNADVATFTGNSTQTLIAINSSTLNVKSVTFSGSSEPAYTVGSVSGSSLFLTSGGSISVASSTTGSNLTNSVNAPLVLEPATSSSAGTYTFSNASATTSHPLIIGSTVTGGTTSAGITLNLQGGNTGSNAIGGAISDGSAAGGLSVSKSSNGVWSLSVANTYRGGTTITAGTLRANTAGRVITASTLTSSATGTGTVRVGGTGVLAGTAGGTGDVIVGGDGSTNFPTGGTITAGSGATQGDTISTLTTGTETWNTGGKFYAKFSGFNGSTATASGVGSAGANWDLLSMGTLSITNGFGLTLTKTTSGTAFTTGTIGYFRIASTGVITTSGNGTLSSGTVTGDENLTSLFALDTSTLGLGGGDTFRIQSGDDGTGLFLAVNEGSATPEPTTVALFGVGTVPLLGRRRRVGTGRLRQLLRRAVKV